MKKIGKLDAIEIAGTGKGCVVLFHGYGADAFDLSPLGEAISSKASPTWIFPNAPLTTEFGGRAWFPIQLAALEKDWREKNFEERANTRPHGLDRAVAMATEQLDLLPFPKSQIVLGGFSQGAMVATDLVLASNQTYAGLMILSGSLIDAPNWKTKAQELRDFIFLQSHGAEDPVLPVTLARELHQTLQDAGWFGELVEFRGGHEIPTKVIQKMGSYIDERLLKSR